MSPEVRPEAWKFLLGYYSSSSTAQQRTRYLEEKRAIYFEMRQQWCNLSTQESNINSIPAVIRDVIKDAARTDRHTEFYSDPSQVRALSNILITYCTRHGGKLNQYSQGMSDLLAPLLSVLQNEADAFWCLDLMLARMPGRFEEDGQTVHFALQICRSLLLFVCPLGML